MNFIKNSLSKLFGKAEKTASAPSEAVQAVEVPEQELLELFELTATFLTASKQPMPDEAKLEVYGLYKQATLGDCSTPKPAIYEFVNKAKWDSWNGLRSMPKTAAMKSYIAAALKADPSLQAKITAAVQGEDYEEQPVQQVTKYEGGALKMVEQVDFSDSYSHPYFRPIEKGEPIAAVTKQLLLQPNNSPNAYPLHFAIDKERADLVADFLPLLSRAEIEQMRDGEGTGILEYAELIENEEILALIRGKLSE